MPAPPGSRRNCPTKAKYMMCRTWFFEIIFTFIPCALLALIIAGMYQYESTSRTFTSEQLYRHAMSPLLHWQGKVKSTLHRQESIFGTSAYHFKNTSAPSFARSLLRIPNHKFDYSGLLPLETSFAQDDHVPRPSRPGHCPSTLHRITINLCNVALLFLLHIVRTYVVRGIGGLGEG
jgi:hypothetical protein